MYGFKQNMYEFNISMVLRCMLSCDMLYSVSLGLEPGSLFLFHSAVMNAEFYHTGLPQGNRQTCREPMG